MNIVKENIGFIRGQDSKKMLDVGINTPENISNIISTLYQKLDEIGGYEPWTDNGFSDLNLLTDLGIKDFQNNEWHFGYEDTEQFKGWYLYDGKKNVVGDKTNYTIPLEKFKTILIEDIDLQINRLNKSIKDYKDSKIEISKL